VTRFLLGLAGVVLWTIPAGAAIARVAGRRDPAAARTLEDRLFLTGTAGLSLLVLAAQLLGRLGLIDAPVAWGGGIAVASLSGIVLLATRGRAAPRTARRELLVVVGWLLGTTLVVLLPFLALIAARPDSFPAPTPWYYWSLARQTAHLGTLPATTVEWGTVVPFLSDYPGFTAMTALVAHLTGTIDHLHGAQVVRALAPAGTALGMYALARTWGSRQPAALAAAVTLAATTVFSTKLSSYRPEAFGYALMFLVPALTKRHLDTGGRGPLVVAALGFAALAQLHGLTWTVAAILAIATLLAAPAVAGRAARRRSLRTVAVAALVLGVAWAGTSLLLSGRISDAGKLQTAPAIAADGTDPTWVFASFGTALEGTPPPTSSALLRSSLGKGFTGEPGPVAVAVVVLAAAALAVVAARRDRGYLVFLLLCLLGLALVSVLFALGWSTYVPRRTGTGRILQLAILLVPLTLAVGASRLPWRRIRRGAIAGVVLVSLALWGRAVPVTRRVTGNQQPPANVLTFERNTPLAPGIALANAYTEGYLPVVFGVPGLLDGRAPYTEASLLTRANTLRADARAFFADPLGHPFDFAAYDVRYVIVGKGVWALGTSRWFPADEDTLAGLPALRLLARGPRYDVYEVRDR